jgi:endonuclease III
MVVSDKQLDKEYKFILKISKENNKEYLKYLLIFAFKGQRPFHIKSEEVAKYWNNLSEKDEDLEKSFEMLQKLDGVGFSTASAILHFKFPDNFAIIDNNVLIGIKKGGKNPLGEIKWKKEKSKLETYKKYLEFIRKKAEKEKISLRDVEKRYFEMGRNEAKKELKKKRTRRASRERKG